MAQKPTVLGMLIAIHSLGLIFASLFIHKWYVTDIQEIGIFGICQYFTYNYNQTNYIFGNSAQYIQCYQLLWPDTDAALQYLSTNPVYLTGLQGVAITSTALGFLTFLWSFLCVAFSSFGSHPRSCELLVLLSALTDASIITTFGMFLGKDNRLYDFKYYGVSFWCSIGAASGFALTTVLFTLSRINTGFKYKLKYYQSEFNE